MGVCPNARVESSAAIKTQLGINFVEVLEHAADGRAFVIVERLLERAPEQC